MIGRAEELELITRAFAEQEDPSFVIVGAAGVGKSRLATEVAKSATAAGYESVHVVGTRAAAEIPLGAFAPLLPEVKADGGGPAGLLHNAAQALLNRVDEGIKLLVVVDDAQLLDSVSATLVHQLATQARCSLVATVRTPGTTPDPITSLWKDARADRIELAPLAEEEVELLATSLLGGPATGPMLRWLFESSGGNPLFVRELLRGAADGEALKQEGGVWSIRTPWRAPDRLVELVETRLAGLSEATLEVLDLLALGEPLGFDILAHVGDQVALEAAERSGLLVVEDDRRRSTARVAHPLYGDVLRQRMGTARMRRLSGRLAGAVEATGMRRHDDELRVARWQVDARIKGDGALLTRATVRARAMFDFDLVKRLAYAALAAGGGPEAGLALGEALIFTGGNEEAESMLAAQALRCVSDQDRAAIARARYYNLCTFLKNRELATAVVEQVLAEITEPGPRLVVQGQVASDKVMTGNLRGGLADALDLLESEEEALRALGAYPAALAFALLGRPLQAVSLARAAEAEHAASGWVRATMDLTGQILGLAGAGHLAEAAELATSGFRIALSNGDEESISTLELLRGWVAIESGRISDAIAAFRAGAAIDREDEELMVPKWSVGGTMLAEAMAGNLAAAEAARAELESFRDHPHKALDIDLVDRGYAWLKVAAGEPSAARSMLAEAAAAAVERGAMVTEARLLHDIVRLGDARAVAPRLKELAGLVEGDLVRAYSVHAAARVDGSPTALDRAAQGLEEVGSLLAAAEVYTVASTVFSASGYQRQANADRRRSAELFKLLGTPAAQAADGGEVLARLTKREIEVARLAAAGTPSPEIAARLFLSVRTVHNHLQHVFTKVGVSSREELAELLDAASD
jgi:DNA-binding CsgD family transcriptional regulator